MNNTVHEEEMRLGWLCLARLKVGNDLSVVVSKSISSTKHKIFWKENKQNSETQRKNNFENIQRFYFPIF